MGEKGAYELLGTEERKQNDGGIELMILPAAVVDDGKHIQEYRIWTTGYPTKDEEEEESMSDAHAHVCFWLNNGFSTFHGIPKNLPKDVSPWHWGGIHLQLTILLMNKHNCMKRKALTIGVMVLIVLAALPLSSVMNPLNDSYAFDDDHDGTGMWWFCSLPFYWVAIRLVSRHVQNLQTDQLHRDLQDLATEFAPFYRSQVGYNLEFVVPSYGRRSRSYLRLVRLTDDDVGEASNESGKATRPPQWNVVSRNSMRTVSNPSFEIDFLRPWWMPPSTTTRSFTPTALQGHEVIDCCTWGLTHCLMEVELRDEDANARCFAFVLLMGVANWFLSGGDPENTTLKKIKAGLLAWLLFANEFWRVSIQDEKHNNCKSLVKRLKPVWKAKCGYDLEYVVKPGCCFGSTSSLRMAKVPNVGDADLS